MKNVNCHMKLKQCIARGVSNEMRIVVTKHKSLYRQRTCHCENQMGV